MTIYEAVGMAWVVFTSALAHIAIFYLAYIGLRYRLEPTIIHTKTIHQEIPGVQIDG